MKWIFAPIAAIGVWRNKLKVTVAGAVFIAPMLMHLAAHPPGTDWWSIATVAAFAFAIYAYAALHVVSDSSWAGIQVIAKLLMQRDLRAETLPQLPRRAGEQDGKMGRLLKGLCDMHSSLREVLGQVMRGATVTRETSERLAAGTRDLAQRTIEQASTLEQTAAAMQELSATVRKNAESCRSASDLVAAATGVARMGAQRVGDCVATMERIDQSARRIEDIIGVIDGIAFQTNILALNAAVEAARAGDNGRGFMVVASEVRSLAQRSADAAREIKALIAESTASAQEGSRLVRETRDTIAELAASVEQVNGLIGEIAVASREQSSGVEGVNGAIVQLQGATEKNSMVVREAAHASESFQGEAVRLIELVAQFRLDGASARGAPARVRVSPVGFAAN